MKSPPKAAERPYAEIDGVKVNPLLAQYLFPISELVPDPENARLHSDQNIKAIMNSLSRVGFQSPILFDPVTRQVVVGNGRLEAAAALGWARVPCIPFSGTKDEIRAFAIADNQAATLAEWNYEQLTNTLRELQLVDFPIADLGFADFELGVILAGTGAETPPAEGTGQGEGGEGSSGAPGSSSSAPVYTQKIKAPVYEIRGLKPQSTELVDTTRTDGLKKRISEANLPENVADFLYRAADRHTVFRYDLIAEFYAHSSPEVRDLMEESALVIIDYNKAIELGFVKLTTTIMGLVEEEEASQLPEEEGEEEVSDEV